VFDKLLFFVLVEGVLRGFGEAAECDDAFCCAGCGFNGGFADAFGETEGVYCRDEVFEVDFG
jgi:hypothetical protein